MAADLSDGPLDLSGFRSAVQSFGEALDVVATDEFQRLDARWQNTLIAGVVQHFEFTFELSWKMLKRQLERELPSAASVDTLSYRELIRQGHERGLVVEVIPWFEFRELRNITTHSYARDKALKVVAGARALLEHAQSLLLAIAARNHD
jgi:nucleotidyltransferase substrate binding protein (TIGR01987 family)